jgi:amidohydrolase
MHDLVQLRRWLHRYPELSGNETETAERISRFLALLKPDNLLQQLGGHGVAAIFDGESPGPTIVLRCELDALPIHEGHDNAIRSVHEGTAHLCGHDGHMAIMCGVATSLARSRPEKGRIVLLFQPSEETGKGASAVLADSRFSELSPDFVFALHNLPGYALGQIIVRAGTFNCGSRGLEVRLKGVTAHAAQPETGVSPAAEMCQLVEKFSQLRLPDEFGIGFATVVGCKLGERAFGTAPGDAQIWVTLRCETEAGMTRLVDDAETLVANVTADRGIAFELAYDDVFAVTTNASVAVRILQRAADDLPVAEKAVPFRWSEDFGQFTDRFAGALFGLGAGKDVADLHQPNYAFPDELIPIGVRLFERVIRECLAVTPRNEASRLDG